MASSSDLVNFHSNQHAQPLRTDVSMFTEHQLSLLAKAHNLEWGANKFKVQWFVGEAQFTPFGKLRQWLLELKVRENNIETIEYDIAKMELEEKIFLRDSEVEEDDLKKQILLVEAIKKRKDIDRTKLRVSDVYKERTDILKLIDELLSSEDGKTPDGRSLMEVFGTPEEDEYEKHYWTVRLAKQAALDLSSYGRIGAGNMEAILMCAPEQQTEIIALANRFNLTYDKRQDLIRNAMAKELGLEAGKSLYIGQVDASLIDNALQADKPGIMEDLKNQEQKNITPDAEDLNNVYNL